MITYQREPFLGGVIYTPDVENTYIIGRYTEEEFEHQCVHWALYVNKQPIQIFHSLEEAKEEIETPHVSKF